MTTKTAFWCYLPSGDQDYLSQLRFSLSEFERHNPDWDRIVCTFGSNVEIPGVTMYRLPEPNLQTPFLIKAVALDIIKPADVVLYLDCDIVTLNPICEIPQPDQAWVRADWRSSTDASIAREVCNLFNFPPQPWPCAGLFMLGGLKKGLGASWIRHHEELIKALGEEKIRSVGGDQPALVPALLQAGYKVVWENAGWHDLTWADGWSKQSTFLHLGSCYRGFVSDPVVFWKRLWDKSYADGYRRDIPVGKADDQIWGDQWWEVK